MATRNEPLPPGVRIHCTDMLEHELSGIRPDDVGSRRVFRFSCDVELCGHEVKTENGPTWLSLEFIGVGTPVLVETTSPKRNEETVSATHPGIGSPGIGWRPHPCETRLAEVSEILCANFHKDELSGLDRDAVGHKMRFSVDVDIMEYVFNGVTQAEREAESAWWRLRPCGEPVLEEIPA